MKTLKSIKLFLSMSVLSAMILFNGAYAQEYDDMYFNKSDRKTVKVKKSDLKTQNKAAITDNYKEITSSTENVSSKNINPEYIARYKNVEPETEQPEATVSGTSDYSGDDYYVENYDIKPGSGMVKAEDYMNSKKYDREYTSQTKTNSGYNGFHPSFSMGFGYSPYGFNPYMGMGMGYGMGYGMSYSMSMSWGMGGYYDPWMFNPTMSYYDMYMMSRFYRPWRYPYYGGYNPYGGFGGGLSMNMGFGMGMGLGLGFGYSGGGYNYPYYPYNPGYGEYNSNVKYQARHSGRSTTSKVQIPQETTVRRTADNTRSVRVPARPTSTTSGSNARIAKDYSRTQNEYYNNSRSRSTSSRQRVSSSSASRYNYRAPSASRSTRSRSTSASTINNNRPVRKSSSYAGSSSGYQSSGTRSSSSGASRSYSPTRSYSSGSSSFGGSSSSYSGGSSSGSRSSGGSSRSRH